MSLQCFVYSGKLHQGKKSFFLFFPSISNVYPASHDVPDGCGRSVCLDGVLTGVRQGNTVTSMKES